MEHRHKNASSASPSRAAANNASPAGKSFPAPVQRFVTFQQGQEFPVVLGKQGSVGYDLSNIDALADMLLPGQEGAKRRIMGILGRFLDEGIDICFESEKAAIAWINSGGQEPPAEVAKKQTGAKQVKGRDIVYAYRFEGQPKSDKQSAGVKKHLTPGAAYTVVIENLQLAYDIGEPELATLKELWGKLADMKDEARAKQIKTIKTRARKPAVDAKNVMEMVNATKLDLDEKIDTGEVFASRIEIDSSFLVSSQQTQGKITGLSDFINFSVGSSDHASYFMSSFNGKGILIRFALDKNAWREWKTQQTGPQKSGLGPSASNASTTLNDVGQPGVKYEMSGAAPKSFFDTVVVKDIPVVITTMSPAPFKASPQEIEHTFARLQKAQQKLEAALDPSREAEFETESQQNEIAKKMLSQAGEGFDPRLLEELYTAMNLTKNALHSARRKNG